MNEVFVVFSYSSHDLSTFNLPPLQLVNVGTTAKVKTITTVFSIYIFDAYIFTGTWFFFTFYYPKNATKDPISIFPSQI